MRFDTRAVHVGNEPDELTGAVTPPIYTSSTFAQAKIAKTKGYEYSRSGNPTRARLERAVADLEGGEFGLAFSSGLAAETAVAGLLGHGDHVLICNDVYGGTFRLFNQVFSNFGVAFDRVDARDPETLERAVKPRTKMVWMESPTNPLMLVLDIRKVAKFARSRGLVLAVDNTFASPCLQNPLKLGATVVVHSTTKYIGGHSDLVGGAVVTSDRGVYDKVKFLQNATGGVPGPFDCYLALRGLRTIHLRMRRHSENASAIVEALSEDRARVAEVRYPFLKGSENDRVARRQMSAGGGMLAFRVKGGYPAASRFLESLKVFTLGESLGGVESLAEHPARMTHASIPTAERRRLGITDDLIRLSVGIEDPDDLVEDVRAALKAAVPVP
ncbi:MAG: aminotransferase class I/II-fold pyridoxal phosphate-dependent enzyme [Nitrososphaerota archaeon]|nr:aminotransferase class I/II-fold pyridoxal phosphate-dependent enzyme [Nitrososphaerota archaeon]